MTDGELLTLIKADLQSSPFEGEGHRKVWARLRFSRCVRVAPKRILRVMRESRLLSPHRVRQGTARAHNGTITTAAPNIMWGTDGLRVQTVDDAWCWVFTAVEHWNAECVGLHVCKHGTRFAALEPICEGVMRSFGTPEAGVARGLALRMDHGTQYTADHFLNQIRYWGISASFALVSEPQTNGVAERFNRTLKEQVLNGRVFRNIEEVRSAVTVFIEHYNREWRVEKHGFRSPMQARQAYDMRTAA